MPFSKCLAETMLPVQCSPSSALQVRQLTHLRRTCSLELPYQIRGGYIQNNHHKQGFNKANLVGYNGKR